MRINATTLNLWEWEILEVDINRVPISDINGG